MARDKAYHEAETKIEEARRSGALHLDLGGGYDHDSPKLTELPPALAKLTQLRFLNLSNHRLMVLPDWIGSLELLEDLDLRGAQGPANPSLTKLPDSLGQLSRLQNLVLFNNSLRELPQSLAGLGALQRLDVRRTFLKEVPDWIGKLSELRELAIGSHWKSGALGRLEISSSVDNLTKLNKLRLERVHVSALARGFARNRHLRELELTSCELSALPTWLSEFTQLRSLHSDHNRLTSLPEWVCELDQLEILQVSQNALSVRQ